MRLIRQRQFSGLRRLRRNNRPLLGPYQALNRPVLGRFLPIFTDFSDFLGRLQPSETTIQKTLGTPGVVPSSHYQLGSVSRTSGTLLLPRFSGPPRGSQEDFLGRERKSQTSQESWLNIVLEVAHLVLVVLQGHRQAHQEENSTQNIIGSCFVFGSVVISHLLVFPYPFQCLCLLYSTFSIIISTFPSFSTCTTFSTYSTYPAVPW